MNLRQLLRFLGLTFSLLLMSEIQAKSMENFITKFFHSEHNKEINVVLDLDGTLATSIPEGKPDFEIRHISFGLAPGAIEFLGVLAKTPDLKLSFFSAGESVRNELLVKKMMNLVFKKTFKYPRYNLLSKDRVSYGLGSDPQVGRKNLTLISKKIDLGNTVLVDDNCTSFPSQEENLLKLISGLGERTLNPSLDHEVKQNLPKALGLILIAIEEAKKNKEDFTPTLYKLQQNLDPARTKEAIERGVRAMKEINPSFRIPE